MKVIREANILELTSNAGPKKDKQVTELFNGPFRRIVEVKLKNHSILARHHASEPITVYCISGSGTFRAGPDLEDSVEMRSGTLLTLDAGVEHEVIAEPELCVIVSKFKDK